MAIIFKANKVDLFVSCFVCFLLPFTEHFRHTTYKGRRITLLENATVRGVMIQGDSIAAVTPNNQVLERSNGLNPRQDFGLRYEIPVVFGQGDQKVSVHLMIKVQKTVPTQLMI
jgi:hypothetical protein